MKIRVYKRMQNARK